MTMAVRVLIASHGRSAILYSYVLRNQDLLRKSEAHGCLGRLVIAEKQAWCVTIYVSLLVTTENQASEGR